jgi:hypothetical protein
MKLISVFLLALISFNCTLAIKWIRYEQCVPQWGNDPLGSKTICSDGAIITSIAMALATFNKGCPSTPCDPRTLNDWLKKNNGYQGNQFQWPSVAKLGLTFEGLTKDVAYIQKVFNEGAIVILAVEYGSHWALMTGPWTGLGDKKRFAINDPKFKREACGWDRLANAAVYKKSFFTVQDLLLTL